MLYMVTHMLCSNYIMPKIVLFHETRW